MTILRDLIKMQGYNDGSRTLFESVMVPEVIEAFNDWIKATDTSKYVLIGGMALSYYVKPRYTEDTDVLFISKDDIPAEVPGFKRHRPGAFQHNKTHVEIEVVTPDSVNIPSSIVKQIYDDSIESNGIRLASPEGLIVSKLKRFKLQDQADIEELIKFLHFKIDLSAFDIPNEWKSKLDALIQIVKDQE